MFLNNTQLHTLIPCMVYQPISPYPRSPSRLSHWYHHTIQTGLNRPTTQLWLISLETLKYPTCTSTITWYVIWYLGKANTSNNWLDLLYHLDQPTHHTLTHKFQEITSKKRKKNNFFQLRGKCVYTFEAMKDFIKAAKQVGSNTYFMSISVAMFVNQENVYISFQNYAQSWSRMRTQDCFGETYKSSLQFYGRVNEV